MDKSNEINKTCIVLLVQEEYLRLQLMVAFNIDSFLKNQTKYKYVNEK